MALPLLRGVDERLVPEDIDQKLAQTCQYYFGISQRGEDVRRRDDRIGARLWHGQHWVGVRQYRDRAAITANVSQALIHHKVSIMTKQQPIPIVKPREPGSVEAAERMRQLLISKFKDDNMLIKTRDALILCNSTRTSAGKVVWDSTLNNGMGDFTVDVIPGWNLLLDGRVSDKERMQFCGDRARMFRSRAITLYPEAAQKIMDGTPAVYRRGMPGQEAGSPIRDAWGTGQSLMRGSPTTLNGKAVFTAYAGDPGFATEKDDIVEICELYHKDLTVYEDEEPEKDNFGNPKHEIVRDEEGLPQVEHAGSDLMIDEDGTPVHVAAFKIVTQALMKIVYKRKYPDWRRTTVLLPGGIVLEDIAWDGPLPYFYFNDVYSLEGMWHRGSILQLETLQAMLNVALSTQTDNMRFASIQALLVSSQSGLGSRVITPGPGQAVEVNGVPVSQHVMPLPVQDPNPEWFNYINQLIALMEKTIGAEGIMQGSAASAPRTDSAAGFGTLAEIGGSRLTENTQRMADSLSDWANISAWFVQNYYTKEHSFAVEDDSGNISHEQAWGPLVQGELDFSVEVEPWMAWSESTKFNRNMELLQAGIIDRVEFYKRTNFPGWQRMLKRMASMVGTPMQALMGGAGAPPKRTRQTVPKKKGGQ